MGYIFGGTCPKSVNYIIKLIGWWLSLDWTSIHMGSLPSVWRKANFKTDELFSSTLLHIVHDLSTDIVTQALM
jgi:hypothetical protein